MRETSPFGNSLFAFVSNRNPYMLRALDNMASDGQPEAHLATCRVSPSKPQAARVARQIKAANGNCDRIAFIHDSKDRAWRCANDQRNVHRLP
ncbi:hypothetical protein F9K73_13605 [Brucella intermedia]|nr:hypothetical protein F9K73_13605 [Brucella intermedia]